MAEGGVNFTDCSICLETFKTPRILPCGHTLCTECLESLMTAEISQRSCPECRKAIPTQGIEEFPVNYALTSAILEPRHTNANHTEFSSPTSSSDVCSTHNLPEDFFCRGRKCFMPVCKNCWSVCHSGHIVVPIEMQLQVMRQKVAKNTDEVMLFKTAEESLISEVLENNLSLNSTAKATKEFLNFYQQQFIKRVSDTLESCQKKQDNIEQIEQTLESTGAVFVAVKHQIIELKFSIQKEFELTCAPQNSNLRSKPSLPIRPASNSSLSVADSQLLSSNNTIIFSTAKKKTEKLVDCQLKSVKETSFKQLLSYKDEMLDLCSQKEDDMVQIDNFLESMNTVVIATKKQLMEFKLSLQESELVRFASRRSEIYSPQSLQRQNFNNFEFFNFGGFRTLQSVNLQLEPVIDDKMKMPFNAFPIEVAPRMGFGSGRYFQPPWMATPSKRLFSPGNSSQFAAAKRHSTALVLSSTRFATILPTKGSLKFLRESASRSEHELNRAGDLKFSLSSFDSKTKRIFVYRSQNSLCSFDLQLRPSSNTQLDLVVGKGKCLKSFLINESGTMYVCYGKRQMALKKKTMDKLVIAAVDKNSGKFTQRVYSFNTKRLWSTFLSYRDTLVFLNKENDDVRMSEFLNEELSREFHIRRACFYSFQIVNSTYLLYWQNVCHDPRLAIQNLNTLTLTPNLIRLAGLEGTYKLIWIPKKGTTAEGYLLFSSSLRDDKPKIYEINLESVQGGAVVRPQDVRVMTNHRYKRIYFESLIGDHSVLCKLVLDNNDTKIALFKLEYY
ncbi:uncharacterized protein LOC142351015 isoform X2 [Convolutriloba macropyga]|uniref:uncharacterized protein LOC142351015 isoform X2 n=1 Tax=Convolutriloba macropyga TaxID=536237 RepID=UPI003F525259